MISIILSSHPKAPSPKLAEFFGQFNTEYEIIYTSEKKKPLYNRILVCGLEAINRWCPGAVEGYGLRRDGNIILPCFCPHVGFYHFLNTDKEDADEADNKDSAPTRARNYLYWIKQFFIKLLTYPPADDQHPKNGEIILYPRLEQLTELAKQSHPNRYLYVDIENRRSDHSLHCIGLAYENGPIYVVPIYRWNNQLAWPNPAGYFRTLSQLLAGNHLVIHNCQHDIAILSYHYSLPFSKSITDTMLTEHRISPETEKSLSHCIARYTTLSYHKDQGLEPFNDAQERQLWNYNARDIHAMRLIHQRQSILLGKNPDIALSADQANQSIYPYRLIELKGMKVDENQLQVQKMKFAEISEAWSRILNVLVGYEINPASSQQVGNYLFNEMKYASLETTARDKDATGTKILYRLLSRYKNPAIQLIIKLREVRKTMSMLEFESI